MGAYIGEIAALATALFFAVSSTIFTVAGRKVGSLLLNHVRLVLATLFLIVAHWVLQTPLPLNASAERWFWLGLSGVIGLTIGDAFLFEAFIAIGPRLSMLMMSLAPLMAALLAWIFLHETLTPLQVAGMILALVGVGWVVMDPHGSVKQTTERRNYIIGLLTGLGAMTGQAMGLITAKIGAGSDFPAISGSLIRMIAATIALYGFSLLTGRLRTTFSGLQRHRSVGPLMLLGAFFGPIMGVTLSLYAVQRAEIGVASTLMALTPIILLPITYIFFQERFGWRAIVGTVFAITGVALLFIT